MEKPNLVHPAIIETHPLKPFLPENGKLLMLGSFPPPKARWKMNFYYPNYQNDMWRIFGLCFFQDKNHFFNLEEKITMYYAKVDKFVGQNLDADEFITVSKRSLNEIIEMIFRGEIEDGKTIAMAFMIKELLARKNK